jgi:hypothetical protein
LDPSSDPKNGKLIYAKDVPYVYYKSQDGVTGTIPEWAIIKKFGGPTGVNEAFGREEGWVKQLLTNPVSDMPQWFVESIWHDIGEWLDENAPQVIQPWLAVEGVESATELNPEYWWEIPVKVRAAYISDNSDEIRSELMRLDPNEAPTGMHMDFEAQITKPVWLTHFSENAYDIAHEGFTRGIADPEKLGLTTFINNDSFEKEGGGYTFAFLSDSNDAEYSANKASQHSGGYGEDFVMFVNVGGVKAYHWGDEESQIIIWGPSVDSRDLILVTKDDDDYSVNFHPTKAGKRDVVVSGLSYREASNWVQQNYDQYRKMITGW